MKNILFRNLKKEYICLLLFYLVQPVFSQPGNDKTIIQSGHPVRYKNSPVFKIYASHSSYSIEERALIIEHRLAHIPVSMFSSQNIQIIENVEGSTIYVGPTLLANITKDDARIAGINSAVIANNIKTSLIKIQSKSVPDKIIQSNIPEIHQDTRTIKPANTKPALQEAEQYIRIYLEKIRIYVTGPKLSGLFINIFKTVGLILAMIILIWLSTKAFNRIFNKLGQVSSKVEKPFMVRNKILLTVESFQFIAKSILKFFHLIISLLLIYLFAGYILYLFPDTTGFSIKLIIRGIIHCILLGIMAVFLFKSGNSFFKFCQLKTNLLDKKYLTSLQFQNVKLLSEEQFKNIIGMIVKISHFLYILILFYLFISLMFAQFPYTSSWGQILFSYIARPIQNSISSFISYLPNLFFILITIFIVRYSIRIMRSIFGEIQKNKIKLKNFHPEWAIPTHRLLVFVLIGFSGIIIFPYLPGSGSDAFKGISLFVGLMLSLGSSAIIANIVAGIVVTYMRPFKIGDRVKISDTVGNVIEKTLLVTRIRTIKNVDITIPNGMVLGSHIINYSSSAQDQGLILNTTITIGYDIHFTRVEKLLIEAALATEFVLKEPLPFVRQISLDDYYVSYEINAYTQHTNQMSFIYSDLNKNIQSLFHADGIEIMSPHFYALRDGQAPNIPDINPQV